MTQVSNIPLHAASARPLKVAGHVRTTAVDARVIDLATPLRAVDWRGHSFSIPRLCLRLLQIALDWSGNRRGLALAVAGCAVGESASACWLGRCCRFRVDTGGQGILKMRLGRHDGPGSVSVKIVSRSICLDLGRLQGFRLGFPIALR